MTTLRVPVRVRLELAADRTDEPGLPDLVASAVEAAAGRALRRAATLPVVATATIADEPRCTVALTGDPLPGTAAHELEAAVRAALARAATPLRTRPATAPDPVARPPRVARRAVTRPPAGVAAGNVTTGTAETAPADRPVPTAARGRRPARPAPPGPGRTLVAFATLQELVDAVLQRTAGDPPELLVVLSGLGHGTRMSVLQRREGGVVNLLPWDFEVLLRLPSTGPRGARTAHTAVRDGDHLRYVGTGANREARVAILATLEQEALRAAGFPSTGPTDLADRATEIATDLASPDRGSAQIFQIAAGDQAVPWEAVGVSLPEHDMPLLVLAERAGPDPGYGGNCPPLASAGAEPWYAAIGFTTTATLPGREEAFLFEPPLYRFPYEVGTELRDRMADVAAQLHVTAGRFVGGFLLGAMVEIERRCRTMAHSGAPIGDQLVEIAGGFGAVRALAERYRAALRDLDAAHGLDCPLAGQTATWDLHFVGAFEGARDAAVGSMFVSACQDRLIQVLIRSHRGIRDRIQNLDRGYVAYTRELLLGLLADLPRLSGLRARLRAAERQRNLDQALTAGLSGGALTWPDATDALLEALDTATRPATAQPGDVRFHRGVGRVLDDAGRWWTAAELDRVMAAARQQAVAADPFLDKLTELPELVARLQAALREDARATQTHGTTTDAALHAVLLETLVSVEKDNEEFSGKAVRDRSVAFGLATFREQEGEAEIAKRMSGVYAVADQFLRPAFTDQDAYASGVNRLADREIERAAAKSFFELVGLTLLAVFFPEIAFVVGVGMALAARSDAEEHADLQHGMIDGDAILSKAQVEAELWSANIGIALAVLPEVPSALRGGAAVLRGEGEVVEVALRRKLSEIASRLAEMSIEHFALSFAKELATAELLQLVLGGVMERVADAVSAQVGITGEAGLTDLGDVLARALGDGP